MRVPSGVTRHFVLDVNQTLSDMAPVGDVLRRHGGLPRPRRLAVADLVPAGRRPSPRPVRPRRQPSMSTSLSGRLPDQLPSDPTAKATSTSDMSNAAVAWTPIRIFALLLSGMVSVGLNALEFVRDT